MVSEEDALAGPVHDPGRPGDVADRAGVVETVGVGVDEDLESGKGGPFDRPPRTVCGEACLERVAVHRLGSGRLGLSTGRSDPLPRTSSGSNQAPSGHTARPTRAPLVATRVVEDRSERIGVERGCVETRVERGQLARRWIGRA